VVESALAGEYGDAKCGGEIARALRVIAVSVREQNAVQPGWLNALATEQPYELSGG
jgi:hypothetical protein